MNVRALAAACLAGALGTASAAKAPDKAPAPESAAESAMQDRLIVDRYVGWANGMFVVPATPDVDPALHEALVALANEHLARLRQSLPRWLAEERQHAKRPPERSSLARAINNRFVNEIALWRLESPGAAYDAVFTRAILHQGICDSPDRSSYFGVLTNFMQAVPVADRATLLAGERTLLAHWGQPRKGLPARPSPSLAEEEDATIARLRSGNAVPEAPMSPVLADSAFRGQLVGAHPAVLCALHQWGLAQALRHESPAVALAAWRFATLLTAADWGREAARDAKATDFPPAAAAGGVTGSTVMGVTGDASGRFVSSRVVERRLDVPGVHDNPPVAFETIFDSASLALAPLRTKLTPWPEGGKPPAPVKIAFNWTLQ